MTELIDSIADRHADERGITRIRCLDVRISVRVRAVFISPVTEDICYLRIAHIAAHEVKISSCVSSMPRVPHQVIFHPGEICFALMSLESCRSGEWTLALKSQISKRILLIDPCSSQHPFPLAFLCVLIQRAVTLNQESISTGCYLKPHSLVDGCSSPSSFLSIGPPFCLLPDRPPVQPTSRLPARLTSRLPARSTLESTCKCTVDAGLVPY